MVYEKISLKLYLSGKIIALETPGANFQGNSGSVQFSLHLLQIWFPGPPGMILRMANLVAGNGVFSANIAGP